MPVLICLGLFVAFLTTLASQPASGWSASPDSACSESPIDSATTESLRETTHAVLAGLTPRELEVLGRQRVRQLDGEHWFVTAAGSDDVQIDVPEPLAEVSSPVHVEGRGRGFEGTAADFARFSAVFLDDSDTHPRVRRRLELTRRILAAGLERLLSLGIRCLLVEGGSRVITSALREQLADRAVVAVARKLAVLLHRLWVSGELYDPLYNAHRRRERGEAA
jgi:hypothetical protein